MFEQRLAELLIFFKDFSIEIYQCCEAIILDLLHQRDKGKSIL